VCVSLHARALVYGRYGDKKGDLVQTIVIVSWALAVAIMVLWPVGWAIWFARRYRIKRVVYLYGALVFFVFQIITRVPALQVLNSWLGPKLQGAPTLQIVYLAALGLSAGLFESVGRWVGYRWLFRDPALYDWRHGVAYGIGHGGIESILLVGVTSGLNLAQAVALTRMTLDQVRGLVPEALLAQTLAAREQYLAVQWTDPVLAALERVLTLPFHVAMSLVVLLVFTRKQARWLWLAVLVHGLLDFSVILLARALPGQTWAVELYIALWAAASVWLILRLRRILTQPEQALATVIPERG
jgi:uncharacterized membrane protein YhfC